MATQRFPLLTRISHLSGECFPGRIFNSSPATRRETPQSEFLCGDKTVRRPTFRRIFRWVEATSFLGSRSRVLFWPRLHLAALFVIGRYWVL